MKQGRYAIAIDGPAASGKSSVARELARRLDIGFLSTGETYRAATWLALTEGVESGGDLVRVMRGRDLRILWEGGLGRVAVGGRILDEELRSDEVNAAVSRVSSWPEVRRHLVALQREAAAGCGVVMEGRDIGTVVLADSPHKYFIDASPEERQRRRSAEGQVDRVAERDRADSTRRESPLAMAPDAVRIDTTDLSIQGAVEAILRDLGGGGGAPSGGRP